MAIVNLSGDFSGDITDRFQSSNVNSGTKSLKTTGSVRPAKQADSAVNLANIESAAGRVESSVRDIEIQVQEVQSLNQSISRSLTFKVDKELGVTVVQVLDRATDELIRQIPAEELLTLSRRLKELNSEGAVSSGILLQEKI